MLPYALVGIALFAAGCGTRSSETSTATLTKAEFIERADRICTRTDDVQNDAFEDYFGQRPDAEASQSLNEKAVVTAGLPPLRTELEELDALPVPEGDEEEIQAIIDGIEEAIEEGEEDPGSLVSSKDAGPFTEVGELAGEYGFKACAFPL